MLGRAGEEGQRLRLEAAKSGQVTWQTPFGLNELLFGQKKDESEDTGAKSASADSDGDVPIEGKAFAKSTPRDADLAEGLHDL